MSDPLAEAVAHHRQGRLGEAEALYRQVLERAPETGPEGAQKTANEITEALQLLGLLRHQQGDQDEAERLIRRAIARTPERPGYHFNLAVVLTAKGDNEGAEAAYRSVLDRNPEDADAYNNLGLLLQRRGAAEEAEASFRRAMEIAPRRAEPRVNLGRLLQACGRPEEALGAFDAALEIDEARLDARLARGACHHALQRLAAAEVDFRAVLQARPEDADALNALGGILIQQGRLEDAAGLLRHGLAVHPRDPRFALNLATALEAQHDLVGAETAAQQALILDPAAAGVQIVLARLDRRRGRSEPARARLEKALASTLPAVQKIDALFEYGQVLDRLGAAEAAYAAFTEANALQAASPAARRFDGQRFLDRIAANRAVFTKERTAELAALAPPPEDSRPAPVFFVGFPRSGTTLMERALAAHPDVVTTEERSPLSRAVAQLLGGEEIPLMLEELDTARVAAARKAFWQAAEAIAGPRDGRTLVDKLPLNLVDLGFANLLFPEARAIVALRDPRDVCLSCFMQHFQINDSMANFLDLERTAACYAATMDLWLVYRESLTLAWHEYRYEDLIEDFEGVVRRVLAFIGRDWHADVGAYRDRAAPGASVTPSYRQVSEEIYATAIGRWQDYRGPLAPVLSLLDPYVRAFGYPED